MAKLICRICGKEYDGCRSLTRRSTMFHWRSVACSRECGAEYIKRVCESRSVSENSSATKSETFTIDSYDEALNGDKDVNVLDTFYFDDEDNECDDEDDEDNEDDECEDEYVI